MFLTDDPGFDDIETTNGNVGSGLPRQMDATIRVPGSSQIDFRELHLRIDVQGRSDQTGGRPLCRHPKTVN